MIQYKQWADVPDNLKSKTYCNKERLSINGVEPSAKVYQRLSRSWIDLYDITTLSKKKDLTTRQLEGITRARKTREVRYTCCRCGNYNISSVDPVTKICEQCSNELKVFRKEIELSIEALSERLSWTEADNIGNYVILDIETTGLSIDDEVVELAIIDLKGNTLYNSFIKPSMTIPEEATAIHHITNDMVLSAPKLAGEFPEIDSILSGKTILSYNAEFDSAMLQNTLKNQGIERHYNWKCVMHNEMYIQGADRFISLAAACNLDRNVQLHRALDDCKLVLSLVADRDLIKSLINEKNDKLYRFKR